MYNHLLKPAVLLWIVCLLNPNTSRGPSHAYPSQLAFPACTPPLPLRDPSHAASLSCCSLPCLGHAEHQGAECACRGVISRGAVCFAT